MFLDEIIYRRSYRQITATTYGGDIIHIIIADFHPENDGDPTRVHRYTRHLESPSLSRLQAAVWRRNDDTDGYLDVADVMLHGFGWTFFYVLNPNEARKGVDHVSQ